MNEEIVKEEFVFLDVDVKKSRKKEAIEKIGSLLAERSDLNKKKITKGFLNREKLSTTGFGSNFAIPHTKADIEQGMIAFFRFNEPIDWESMDGEPVSNAIALVMPENDENNQHLEMISKMARLLMHPEFIQKLDELTTEQEISSFLNEQIGGI